MTTKTITHGILLACEGIDGSGKSTLARTLTATLQSQGYSVLLTKEPGGTVIGQQLRTIVQHQPIPLCHEAEFLLSAADRAQHFKEVVLPALAHNTIVISDRMADSSLAYQGYGRGLDKSMLTTINRWVMHNREPDLVLYVKTPVVVAQERLRTSREHLSAFEKEKEDFAHRLYDGFEKLFAQRTNVITLDGTAKPEIIAQSAYTQLISWITKNKF